MPLLRRIANLFSRDKVDGEIDAELRAHIAMREADNIAAGMAPEEARRNAKLRFGNATATKERVAAADAALTLESIWADVRYGIRQLWRSPGFTCVALITLALGIGANTAIFSLIDAALLKMLPVRDPEQLVQLMSISPTFPVNDAFSYPAYKALRERPQVLAGALAFRKLHDIDLEVDGEGGLANGQLVSGNYFPVLGVKAVRGRTLLPSDESVAGENAVAVIGYDYWRSRFALDPNVIGKRILLNNAAFTIVGVTEPEFYGVQPGERIDVSVPLTTITLVRPDFAAAGSPYDTLKAPFRNWLYVMARLKPGVTREQATASLEPVFAQSTREAAAGLTGMPYDSPAARKAFLALKLRLDPASQGLAALRRQFSRPLWVVMAIVGLLLLVTCANVANLLLARANAREREIAVRLAMGAGRRRLIRQLITESILLGVGGGALGLALAYWGSKSLLAMMARGRSPVILSVHPDFAVLGFTFAVSVLTAFVFGAIPALRATRVILSQGLAQGARTTANTSGRSRIGKSLVVVQVAVSLVLIIGAGLLARSLANLKDFYPGFNRDNVLMFTVNPLMIGYKSDLAELYEQMIDRLRTIPGVRSVSLSGHDPLSTSYSTTSVQVQGFVARPGEELAPVNIETAGPEYFATMETTVLRGRDFTAADREGSAKVAIVNESMARHYFGDANPVGRLVSIPGYRGDASWLTIIAEVHDVKAHDLREDAAPMLYMPMLQAPEAGAIFEMRTAMDPAQVETAALDAVKAVNSRLPVFSMKTLGDQVDDSLVEERLVASLSGMFGVLALVLSCVGLYGLMAYMVSRRTVEIGVRMALGAERGEIARMVIGETMLLVAVGLAIGVPAAMGASRLIASQLFGLKPGDPLTIFGACAVMVAVTVLASWLPARRAASVNPIQALRSE
jgi:predicted permease